jgi:hypothetical protein
MTVDGVRIGRNKPEISVAFAGGVRCGYCVRRGGSDHVGDAVYGYRHHRPVCAF